MVDLVARKDVRVANPVGLHIRPAYLIARLASRYESAIEIIKDGQSVNGKSVLEILMLAATQGTVLTVLARGRDADQAVAALTPVIEQESFAEEPQAPEEPPQAEEGAGAEASLREGI
jgi:phosphocarrier protein